MNRICALITLLVLLAAAGCGKEKPAEGTSARTEPLQGLQPAPTATPGPTVTVADLDQVTPADKKYRVVLIVKTRNNPFFSPMISAFEEEAKALGVAGEVQAPPQEQDKERQFAMVQDITARGVDAILIAPADSRAIVPALKAAQDKGVLVINLDNRVDGVEAQAQGLKLGGYVGADNEAGGVLAAVSMREAVGKNGVVAILEGIRGADNAEARKRGFTKGAEGHLRIAAQDSANWDTQQAYAKFQSMLAANPDLQGVFCANDKMALGAMKAISEAGKKGKIAVVGYDNIPDVQPYLASGEMHSTIEQHPDLMGKYGVKMAVGVLTGKVQRGGEYLVPLERVSSLGAEGVAP